MLTPVQHQLMASASNEESFYLHEVIHNINAVSNKLASARNVQDVRDVFFQDFTWKFATRQDRYGSKGEKTYKTFFAHFPTKKSDEDNLAFIGVGDGDLIRRAYKVLRLLESHRPFQFKRVTLMQRGRDGDRDRFLPEYKHAKIDAMEVFLTLTICTENMPDRDFNIFFGFDSSIYQQRLDVIINTDHALVKAWCKACNHFAYQFYVGRSVTRRALEAVVTTLKIRQIYDEPKSFAVAGLTLGALHFFAEFFTTHDDVWHATLGDYWNLQQDDVEECFFIMVIAFSELWLSGGLSHKVTLHLDASGVIDFLKKEDTRCGRVLFEVDGRPLMDWNPHSFRSFDFKSAYGKFWRSSSFIEEHSAIRSGVEQLLEFVAEKDSHAVAKVHSSTTEGGASSSAAACSSSILVEETNGKREELATSLVSTAVSEAKQEFMAEALAAETNDVATRLVNKVIVEAQKEVTEEIAEGITSSLVSLVIDEAVYEVTQELADEVAARTHEVATRLVSNAIADAEDEVREEEYTFDSICQTVADAVDPWIEPVTLFLGSLVGLNSIEEINAQPWWTKEEYDFRRYW